MTSQANNYKQAGRKKHSIKHNRMKHEERRQSKIVKIVLQILLKIVERLSIKMLLRGNTHTRKDLTK